MGSGLWRVGEVWGDDSLSEEVDDVREDCRWTVLWKSLLLIITTREKRRSWKWYSFVGVLASLALMMNRGKRMENKQPLMMYEEGRAVSRAMGKPKPK